MSEENVEIVRGLFDAVSRQDADAVLTVYDPEVEYDFTESPIGQLVGATNVYRGYDGIRQWTRDRYEALEEVEDRCLQLIDAGQSHVISSVITRGRGRASGVQTELHHYGVWTIRNRRVVKVAWFHTLADAATAAGA